MNVIDMKRDHVVRATAANGTIRAFAVYSRGLVEDARRMHELSRTATAALGRTLTAAAMMGTMMKGDKDALSIVFNGDGSLGNITVTAKSVGERKGYVGNQQPRFPPGKARNSAWARSWARARAHHLRPGDARAL